MDELNPDSRRQVIHREREWHEQEAHRRYWLDSLLYDPPAFDTVVNQGFDFLQLQTNERILDLGCGEGKEVLALAQRGLCVIAIDLSFTQLQRVRQLLREQYPEANVHFAQANAEELPFAAHSFRVIYGKAILHHLDLEFSARQITKLLKPGGRASFAEPMAHHPLIWMGRQLTPAMRTQDEHPLTAVELDQFARRFEQAEVIDFFFLTPISYIFRIFPRGEQLFIHLHRAMQKIDGRLFQLSALIRRFAWYKVVNLRFDSERERS
jgi:SAM-dependent methyltransferase